jgi:hypothetical protein
MRPALLASLCAAAIVLTPLPAAADPSPTATPTGTPSASASSSPSPSTSATPSPAPTATKKVDAAAGNAVTVSPVSQSLPAGESRTFRGVVTDDGVPVPGVRLSVAAKNGTGWRFVAHVVTAADGTWSRAFSAVKSTTWRTDFYGTTAHPGAAYSPEYSATITQVPAATRVSSATTYAGGRSGWASWVLHDQLTGAWYGDAKQAQVNNTESMIKVWIAADYLLGMQRSGRGTLTAYERDLIGRMIRNSDDQAAETLYRSRGQNAVINRLISTCKLTDTYIGKTNRWSWTKMSPRDGIRMGLCIQPGKNLWSNLANYLLGEMRAVAASNAFGIQQAYPAGNGVRLAVKNGWTAHGALSAWIVNCLGMWGPNNRWVLVIEARYPVSLGQAYGAATCQEVTRRLFR